MPQRSAAIARTYTTAEAAGKDAVGVILTGMGKDGAEDLLALRRSGARAIRI